MTRVGLAQALQPALLRLEEILHAQWKGQQAGLSVAVISDQDLLWAKGLGYADYARQIPATPQTIYRIASITKLFTATMLMQLRDAGQVQLDDPLTRYLPPSFTIISPFPDAKAPTLRQVVSHTAGLPREAPFDYEEAVPIPSIEVILDEIREIELLVPPMTEWRYSNLGVALLGHALERIAHQPYNMWWKRFCALLACLSVDLISPLRCNLTLPRPTLHPERMDTLKWCHTPIKTWAVSFLLEECTPQQRNWPVSSPYSFVMDQQRAPRYCEEVRYERCMLLSSSFLAGRVP